MSAGNGRALRAVVIDTETTGMDETDTVVELAAVLILNKKASIGRSYLVDPGRPIPPQARGIHHISDDDVKGRPDLKTVLNAYVLSLMPFVPVAHFAEFDSKFLPELPKDWICTWRCAQALWPDAPSYSNQTLRYWLPKVEKLVGDKGFPTHRALPDAWVTAYVFLEMLKLRTIDELIEITKAPLLLKTVRFGKHNGLAWSDVPKEYLKWIITADFDRDTLHTARHHLQ